MISTIIAYIKKLLLLLLSPECYDVFFTEFNFFHSELIELKKKKKIHNLFILIY